MKRIAKSRPGRLACTMTAAAGALHRTLSSGARIRAAPARREVTRSLGVRLTSATSSRTSTALIPAHAGHFDWIASLLREGAAEGSFDADLASESLDARVFFDNLRRMLATGTFLADRGDSAPVATAASGYVLLAGREGHPSIPVGFVCFKAIDETGFELWLCGIQRRYRGRGFCSAMLAAALRTPAGMLAHVARVHRGGGSSASIRRALERAGYRAVREGPQVLWFVREDAPADVTRRVHAA